MVFYSSISRKKVFHLPHCAHVRNINPRYRCTFESPEEARKNHYILCQCCSPVGQHLQKERVNIAHCCQENGAATYLHDGQLIVTTPHSKWKIVASGKANKLMLYHRNTKDIQDPLSPFPNYHYQKVRKNTILEYLEYIAEHDYYRMCTPLQTRQKKKSKPKKGTRRWKSQQKKEKTLAKRAAIKRVYALLDAI